jgi:predicted ester cyclase
MSTEESNFLGTGDQFAVEVTGRGTHKGQLEGPGGPIEPTNKSVDFRGAMFGRTNSDGLITEERRYFDMAGIMGQLGLL